MVVYVVKVNCKLVSLGAEDDKIKIEYEKNQKRTQSIFVKVMDKIVLAFFVLVFIALFGLGVSITVRENNVVGKVPILKVVQSGSMAYVNEYNRYLKEDDVNDHIQVFDVVTIHELPTVEDLKVNDIVLYEIDGLLLVHRIVAIEPPNKEHPDEIHFLLHGDANELPDKFPVKYEQMKGIYLGERVPYVGTFINFMQSPAGYLCILLVIFAVFAVPFAEKKILKVKMARLIAIGYLSADGALVSQPLTKEETDSIKEVLEEKQPIVENETAITVSPQILYAEISSNKFEQGLEEERFVKKEWYETAGKGKTFREKHDSASREILNRYNEIVKHLYKIKGLHVWEGKAYETYKKGRTPIARLAFKGKSLYAHLALNVKDYENTKYVYTDASSVKAYKDYPMRVKVSSDRQVKWVNELVSELANKSGLYMYAMTTLFSIKGSNKTFEQKLKEISSEMLLRYELITNHLTSIEGIKAKQSKKHVAYKLGNKCLCKLTIRGKTLNAYIALDPSAYENTKYIYTDVSSSKSYANYPMRVKVTSERQVKWVKELISIVAKEDKSL